jgi:transcriptional regulator with XRE-family HTH domain
MSQSDIAKAACVSRNEISMIERGIANGKLSTLIAVFDAVGYALEVSVTDKKS